jgi:hypothetical protein
VARAELCELVLVLLGKCLEALQARLQPRRVISRGVYGIWIRTHRRSDLRDFMLQRRAKGFNARKNRQERAYTRGYLVNVLAIRGATNDEHADDLQREHYPVWLADHLFDEAKYTEAKGVLAKCRFKATREGEEVYEKRLAILAGLL